MKALLFFALIAVAAFVLNAAQSGIAASSAARQEASQVQPLQAQPPAPARRGPPTITATIVLGGAETTLVIAR